MAGYQVRFLEPATRDLTKLDKSIAQRTIKKLLCSLFFILLTPILKAQPPSVTSAGSIGENGRP